MQISAVVLIDDYRCARRTGKLFTVQKSEKGAPEVVLARCSGVIIEGEVKSLTSELQRLFVGAQEQMAGNGLRVLALAHRHVLPGCSRDRLEEDLVLDGLVGFEDPPRPESASAIRKCQEAGIKVIMVTGDHPQTALAIAREVGLVKSGTPVVLTGEQLRRELARQDPLYLQATTACLSAIIVSQIVNVFLCRSSWDSVFKLNPFGNRLLLFGVIVEVGLILLIAYTPVGNVRMLSARRYPRKQKTPRTQRRRQDPCGVCRPGRIPSL